MWNNYNPNKAISIGAFFSVGEEFWYDEDNPAVGNHLYTGTFTTIQPNSKLRIRTTIRYSQLKSKVDQSIYFRGSLTRTTWIISLTTTYLFVWLGSTTALTTNFLSSPYSSGIPTHLQSFMLVATMVIADQRSIHRLKKDFELENSQLYFKFQYLFDI